MKLGRKTFGSALLCGALVVLSACGGGSSDAADPQAIAKLQSSDLNALVDAANAEGSLVLYTSMPASYTDANLAAFKAKYPKIQTTYLQLADAKLSARLAAEQKSGTHTVDVAVVANPEFIDDNLSLFVDLSQEKALDTYVAWPDKYKTKQDVSVVTSPRVVTYNNKLVKESDLPKSWQDFTDPKWRGKLVLADPRSSITYMSWAQIMDEKYGDSFLKGIGAQTPAFVQSGVTASQQVAAGQYLFAVANAETHSEDLRAHNAPLSVYTPEGPVTGNQQNAAILAQAAHPAAARLYLEWFLGKDSQSGLCKGGGQSSFLPDVPGCEPVPADYITPKFSISDADQQKIISLFGIKG